VSLQVAADVADGDVLWLRDLLCLLDGRGQDPNCLFERDAVLDLSRSPLNCRPPNGGYVADRNAVCVLDRRGAGEGTSPLPGEALRSASQRAQTATVITSAHIAWWADNDAVEHLLTNGRMLT
jgi:hypothetical protein